MSFLNTLATLPGVRGYVGTYLNALPGYSTLGANIANPNVNYQGQANPGTQHVLGATTGGGSTTQQNTQQNQQSGTQTSNGSGGQGVVDLSSYDQAIGSSNANLNSLTPALQNALGIAQNNYQSTLNGLNQNKAETDQMFTQNKELNSKDYVSNKNLIKTNTGNTIGSISRLAGARGASGQSAVDYARLLAAGQGTQQLSGSGDAFGKNQQALDQSYGSYTNAYNTNLKNADLQRQNEENQARAGTASNRASILQQLAGLVNQRTSAAGGSGVAASQGYVNQAQQALAEASQLSRPLPVAAQTPLVYKAPELSTYTATPTQAAAGGGAQADTVTPILSALLGQNRDKQLAGV